MSDNTRGSRLTRRSTIQALTAAGVTLTTAGCMGGGNNSGSSGDGGNKSGSGGAQKTVNFTHLGSFGKATEAIKPKFDEAYDNLQLKHQQTPAQSSSTHSYYVNQFLSQSNSFDAGQMDVIWPAEFAAQGWVKPVSDPKNYTEKMLDTPVESVTINDKLVGMPLYTDANALYYRKDILDKYGMSPPKTYMELVNQVQEIKEKESKDWNGYIWQGGPNEGLTIMWLNWLWGYGGSVRKNGKIKVNTQKGIKALQHARNLIYKYNVSPRSVVSGRTDQNRQTFQNGNTLFMRNWPYALSLLNEEGAATKGKVGVAPLPNGADHPDAANSCLGGWNVFINKATKNPQAANKFASYLASEEIQGMLATEFNYLPVRSEIYEKEKYTKEFGQLSTFKNILKQTQKRPSLPNYTTFSEIMYKNLNSSLSKQMSPKKALDTAQKKINAKINQTS